MLDITYFNTYKIYLDMQDLEKRTGKDNEIWNIVCDAQIKLCEKILNDLTDEEWVELKLKYDG